MRPMKTLVAGAILAACVSAHAQNNANTPAPAGKAKATKPRAKSEEQILLEQLNDKFHKLDDLNAKYENLQRNFDAMQKSMAAHDAQLAEAQKTAAAALADAADAKRRLEETETAIGSNGSVVTTLQSEVATLKTSSSDLSTQVAAAQQDAKKVANPETIRFKGVDLTPGGFLAAETVDRQRAVSGDVNTPFNSIPFTGQTAGELSEFNASARQSRFSLLAVGKLPSATLRGYYESDFLSAGTTSNDNQSNSYTLRLRQAWAQAQLQNGWTITGGQMWSLATEYTKGLTNLYEAIPLTIDAQYNVGFTWQRDFGFRVVKQVGDRLWFGGSVEEAQTLNIGGHNLPTLLYQAPGNPGGLYSPTANYSFNLAPDLIAKVAYETDWGHFELFGVGRFFRDRVYPNGPLPPGAPQPPTTSALGAFSTKTAGGGLGVNGRILIDKKTLTLGAHFLIGDGMGRYSTAELADTTAHPDGSLELLPGGSTLGTIEWRPQPRFDLYGYYGGEFDKRAYYATGYFVTTPGPTLGQPILTGYGAPTNPVFGCYIEVLPVPSPNGGGNVPGTPANCNADTRNIQEGTVGYWFRFYKGSRGTLQQGIQYSYVVRHTWQGIGDPAAGLTNSPKAIDNMFFTSFRYYLPQ